MTESWYEVVSGNRLAQGDLLLNCPVPRIETYAYPLADMLDVCVDTHHLAVVSQSCDLENDKVDDVLLAAVLDYRELTEREGRGNPYIRGRNWRKAAIRGDLASFSLLPVREEPPAFAWSLVDFHHLFTLPKRFRRAVR